MSVLFYRRPDYQARSTAPLNTSECARYVERAKKSERSIPGGLSFDDILDNKSLPPCSLSDFMDYCVYIEHDAENLQFYLWYRSYVQRFAALPVHQQHLSPPWVVEKKDQGQKAAAAAAAAGQPPKVPRESESEMLHGFDPNESELFDGDVTVKGRRESVVTDENASIATSVASVAEMNSHAGLKWQPFSIQPHREEINRVIRTYLAFTSPRELNLSHRERSQVLHALQHTTHPSAFLPALTIAEAALRGQSHPNFIRWSICNGNRPRVVAVRTSCAVTLVCGTVLAVILILSGVSRWWRLMAAILWFIGLSGSIASYKGLCVILHHSHSRMLKPWEDEELMVNDPESNHDAVRPVSHHRLSSFASSTKHLSLSGQNSAAKEVMEESVSVKSAGWSLNPFGPKNSSYQEEGWWEHERRKNLWKKVFGRSVWTRDENLRVLQDRIVLGANLWAAMGTVVLCAATVSIPELKVF